jgi:long-subunit fatty acid transport protein
MKRLLTLFCIALPSILSAQDFYGTGVSAATARQAGAYAPSAANVNDSLALNPAGQAYTAAPTVNLSIIGVFARGSFSNASNNDSPMASNNGFVPFGAFGSPLGKHWAIGVGVMPDLLSASKWNYSDTPGFAGTTYGPQSEKSQIIAIRAAAAVAYRFSERLSAGMTIGADYNSNTLDAPYIFQSHPVLAGLKTLLDLHTTGYGWNTSYGVMAKPTPKTYLGFSFRTPTPITSHGDATGDMGAEFQALGLNAQPDFGYNAQVHIKLPPSAVLSAGWQATHTMRLSFQTDWTGWRGSFNSLPVTLTQGTNADINSLLQSSTLKDTVPLDWKNQITFRGAVERSLGERFVVGGGYLHGNDPVANSTLSPLTAAIMQSGLTAGAGWRFGRLQFDASYGYDFSAQETVGNSALLYDEYSNSKTRIGTQAFTLSTSFTL